jgi:rubrerythrin
MKFDSVDKILDFAIQKEQNSADFYTDLANKMELEHMKEMFVQFASEEKGHKAKLIAVKDGKQMLAAEERVQDLKIGENLVDVDLSGDLGYQEALILAMKAEKASFRLYNDLATATDDANLKQIFLNLAQEEAKHKLRFEIEYDDQILREN